MERLPREIEELTREEKIEMITMWKQKKVTQGTINTQRGTSESVSHDSRVIADCAE